MVTETKEPENVTLEEVLNGIGICSGYVPGTVPDEYMEIWEYRGYVYAVVTHDDKPTTLHKLGVRW